jgi:tetratricopeptide (TPR) repeat protein
VRYTALYFIGGIAACGMHALITSATSNGAPAVPLIGASGAIAAVIGVVAVRMYRANIRVAYFVWIWLFPKWGVLRMSAALGVGLYLLQEIAYGTIASIVPDGTAHWAHVGGLIAGVALGFSWGALKDASNEYLAEEAQEYAAVGMGDIAVAKYEELAERDPDNPDWLLEKLRSSLTAMMPDPQQIAADFGRVTVLLQKAGRTQDIVDTFKLVAVGPQAEQTLDARTLQTVASAAESLRDWDTAQRAYGTLLVVYPQSGEAERALFRLAHIYLARGMRDEALQTWRAFAESYPQSAWMPYADSGLAAG